jgi:protein transport protein SEC24
MARPPKPASYIFAIDVSWNAIQSGVLSITVATIKDFLYSGQSSLPEGARVAIMTYDKAIHFYNLNPSLEQAQMMVVPDVSDSFMPLSSGFLVDPIASKNVIENLLDTIPTLFASNRIAEPAMGAAVLTAFEALKETGGKLIVFQTALPSFGPGALKNREDVKILGTDKERSMYEPQEFFWRKMGQDCASNAVCVDLYLFPNTYTDVATIGESPTFNTV